MSRVNLCFFVLLFVCSSASGDDKASRDEGKQRVDYTGMPLSFEPNLGQTDSHYRFTAKSPGYSINLDASGARFQFNSRDKSDALQMNLENANAESAVAGEKPLPGKSNYFPTGDPKTWITSVPTYSQVHYGQIYPGVGLTFYGTGRRLEYDFLIQPESDPGQIRMKFSGSSNISIDGNGDLVLSRDHGNLHLLKPVAYQLSHDGKTKDKVEAGYHILSKVNGNPIVTFALGHYDPSRELVIDPVVDALSYSQYLSEYYVSAVAVDSSGNSYVAGQGYPSNYAFYVTQFTPSGAAGYTANFGTGGSYTFPLGLAIDASGNAYLTGYIYPAASTLPTTSNAYQATAGTATYQAFLLKLAAGGATMPYCTYLSGTSDTQTTVARAIAVDSSGKAYIAGYTQSSSLPTTAGAYQNSNTAGTETGFVAKFDTTQSGASSLIYSTLLGSTTDASGTILNGIAVDAGGNAYVAAQGPTTYPVTNGAFRYNGYDSGNGGAYVTKVNPTGTGLVYSAYLGYGSSFGVAVDGTSSSPSAYVTGTVNYADFPTTSGAYQTSYASGFAVKMSADGTSELYSTFLSGPSGYTDTAIAIYNSISLPYGCQSSCNAYISGQTASVDFPAINAIQSTIGSSNGSAFIVELNSTGTSALFSSYLGGVSTYVYPGSTSNYGSTPAIAVDSSGNMYVAGNTNSTAANSDFPQTTVSVRGTHLEWRGGEG